MTIEQRDHDEHVDQRETFLTTQHLHRDDLGQAAFHRGLT